MNFHTDETTTFYSGQLVPTDEATIYLGSAIRKDHEAIPEINTKISKCFATLGRLNYFWNNPNCDTKFTGCRLCRRPLSA